MSDETCFEAREPALTCPTTPVPYDDDPTQVLVGCGSSNVSEPDDEGIVDCLDCGIWFTPALELTTV